VIITPFISHDFDVSLTTPLMKDPVSKYGFDTMRPDDRKKLADSLQASQTG
jgi:hypothetical protein